MRITLGLCLGAGFGLVLSDNIGIGITVGLLLGHAIEKAPQTSRKHRRNSRIDYSGNLPQNYTRRVTIC